jgi:hypothetical protein
MRGLLLALGVLLSAPAAAAQSTPDRGRADDLARLHDALQLNPGQESAWREFTATVQTPPQGEQRRRAAEQLMPNLPTPRRLALMQATLAADQTDLQRTGAAVLRFYDQLSPGQQQTFDKETLPAAGFDRGGR